jgi:hypothetical protein
VSINEWPEFWVAHEEPERPFGPGVWVCTCDACRLALEATVRTNPRFTLMIRTNCDRIGVTADLLLEVWKRDGCVEGLLYVDNDWIRDIGSATNELPDGARWWSLSMEEEVGRREALRHSPPLGRHPAPCSADGPPVA